MKKLANIIKLTEFFYQKAMEALAAESWTMPDDPEESDEDDGSMFLTGNVLMYAEQFDIKNEHLANQIDLLIKSYEAFLDVNGININNLSKESYRNLDQVVDTLNKRYEDIVKNPYTSSDKFIAEEGFNPAILMQFVQNLVSEVEDQLSRGAAQNEEFAEDLVNEYVEELNQQAADKQDSKTRVTGDKIKQSLQARQNWYQEIKFIKKVGKSHPEYYRYENMKRVNSESYHRKMVELKKNPPAYTAYLKERQESQAKWYHSITKEPEKLKFLIEQTVSPSKKEELILRLNKLQLSQEKAKNRSKRHQNKRSFYWNDPSLKGYSVKINTQTDSLKSDSSKTVKELSFKDPQLKQYKMLVNEAQEQLKQNPSVENQRTLNELEKEMKVAQNTFCQQHPITLKARADLLLLTPFREQTKYLVDNQDEQLVLDTIKLGELILAELSNTRPKICVTVANIVNTLKGNTNEQTG